MGGMQKANAGINIYYTKNWKKYSLILFLYSQNSVCLFSFYNFLFHKRTHKSLLIFSRAKNKTVSRKGRQNKEKWYQTFKVFMKQIRTKT